MVLENPLRPGASFKAQIVSNLAAIANLPLRFPHLFANRPATLQPAFFVSTVTAGIWAPRVVVVTELLPDSERIVGVLYARERLLMGIPTGIVLADSTLGALLVSHPDEQETVFSHAIRALVSHPATLAIRLYLPETSHEVAALQRFRATLPSLIISQPVGSHSILRLPATFDSFLTGLSYTTRATFRRYRRHGREDRVFLQQIDEQEFAAAVAELDKKSRMGAKAGEIALHLKMIAAARRPLRAGLRNSAGEWLSVVGGWYESDRLTVCLQQNNDRKFHRSSLSLVMRSHLIESCIAEGISEILFVGGVRGHLMDYAEISPTVIAYIDIPHPVWSRIGELAARAFRLLPANWRRPAYLCAPTL